MTASVRILESSYLDSTYRLAHATSEITPNATFDVASTRANAGCARLGTFTLQLPSLAIAKPYIIRRPACCPTVAGAIRSSRYPAEPICFHKYPEYSSMRQPGLIYATRRRQMPSPAKAVV